MTYRHIIIVFADGPDDTEPDASVYPNWEEAFYSHVDDDGTLRNGIAYAVDVAADTSRQIVSLSELEDMAREHARECEAEQRHRAGLGWPGQAGRA